MSDYFLPKTTEEAVLLASKYKSKAKIIAGGSDLVTHLKSGEIQTEVLVNICNANLNFISYEPTKGLRIGATTSIESIENSSVIQSKFSVLAQAAGMVGSPTIRQRATIGGNICNAAPSADTAPPLIVLSARVKIAGKNGERLVEVEDFFTGPGKTSLNPGEIVTEIQISDIPAHSGATYIKQKRRHGADLAVVGVAVLVTLAGDANSSGVKYGNIDIPNIHLLDIKIALGAVAPVPMRARKAESILKNRQMSEKLLEDACQAASDESSPINDARSSADYRKKMVKILTKDAIMQAIERARLET